MAPAKLKIGCAGLGRMGKRHALHFLNRTPRAELVAASTPDDTEIQWAKVHLEPYGVRLYKDYDEMLQQEGLQAVVIASVTTVHAEQAIKAIDANKHVLVRKAPLHQRRSLAIRRRRRQTKTAPQGHAKMDAGLTGRPAIFRSQTCDMLDPSGFFVAYAQFSGGIFIDCSIHDIDLALWFFGQDSIVKSVVSSGITAVQPNLRKYGDRDNAVGIPMANLVPIYEASGIRREIPPNYYGRFEQAFVNEANEFTHACLEDGPLPMKLSGAVQAVKIGCALQESLRSGDKICFDKTGRQVERAML
ncbi:MAG: hypothetical protein LQ347_004579 [Umbilicaria vellea]|nr:MAG: hypothetical protein LQ347_004579 [Umbilicaria vellea]